VSVERFFGLGMVSVRVIDAGSGGAGAGPDWDGQSCVHVHMTNTAIGDVEMTERIYPVIIHRFSRRHDTGGEGRHKGGDGCIRDVEFTTDLDVAILSQRRVIPPYGMAGGDPGQVGRNEWWRKRKDKEGYAVINLGGSNQASMKAGDRIVISE
jgi:5-oxoprolinase (ATP-hydrolysing)